MCATGSAHDHSDDRAGKRASLTKFNGVPDALFPAPINAFQPLIPPVGNLVNRRGPGSLVFRDPRIDLPTMQFSARPCTFLAAMVMVLATQAQVDTSGYGGPDGSDIYDELAPEVEEDAAVEIGRAARAVGLLYDVNDSLEVIPGYDMYCHWNTDQIFLRERTSRFQHDTLCLRSSVKANDDQAMPCSGHVTSPFGSRKGRMHYGVDLKLQTGDPVVAAFPGMVRISKYNKSFGNVVVVRHHNGLETLYAHLSKRKVEPGDLIEAGDTLGLGGNTGRSRGSHLHFEVRFLDQPIDPTLLFDVETGRLKSDNFEIHKGTFESIAAAKAAAGSRKYHVVRSGDTLSAIARRHGTTVGACAN